MNPGMVVKLRPTGPWRIGPDSGARNRVDAVYHSDSLYAAVTSAMAALGSRDEWLDATARASAPAVCFASCYPFLDEIGFVAPPRTVWPPSSPALMAARVRWKSARFVPLGIVQAILAGDRLDDSQWAVDGASECLVPAGRSGPFRMGVRWNAAVDRLSGASERHSTACLEFRAGAGLWTVVSFADDAARERWSGPVKAAFRWLADSGFGGERSRGWGRSETPEFIEGMLPEMILGAQQGAGDPGPGAGEEPAPVAPPPVEEPPQEEPPAEEPPVEQPPVQDPPAEEPPAEEPAADEASVTATPDVAPIAMADEVPVAEAGGAVPAEQVEAPLEEIVAPPAVDPPDPEHALEAEERAAAGPASPAVAEPAGSSSAYWLLSLYTPGSDDAVDWARGSYSLVTRGGRVDASGELKKQLPMVEEGSVVYAAAGLRGSAPDVAPDGFAHPVFRAGFAVAIPLPEVTG
jgi:CRISPR type III-A-associated RAMP protein Csm4